MDEVIPGRPSTNLWGKDAVGQTIKQSDNPLYLYCNVYHYFLGRKMSSGANNFCVFWNYLKDLVLMKIAIITCTLKISLWAHAFLIICETEYRCYFNITNDTIMSHRIWKSTSTRYLIKLSQKKYLRSYCKTLIKLDLEFKKFFMVYQEQLYKSYKITLVVELQYRIRNQSAFFFSGG